MEKQFTYRKASITARTALGIVRGYESDHISIFKGIPYAKA